MALFFYNERCGFCLQRLIATATTAARNGSTTATSIGTGNSSHSKMMFSVTAAGRRAQATKNGTEKSSPFARPGPEDERSLDEEIPQDAPTVVNEMPNRKKPNCAVYGAGLASTGALAIAKLVRSTTTPQCLIKPMRIGSMNVHQIRHVAAGCGFSLFASSTELYGSGLNNFYQLCGPKRQQEKPNINEGFGPNEADMWYVQGCRIVLPPDAGNICSISAGRMHSVVLTSANKIFCFGSNSHGQCGVNPADHPVVTHNKHRQLSPLKEFPLDSEQQIVKVHACLDTTFALGVDGRLFAWGLGTDGQLGNGNGQLQWQPEPVKGDLEGERVRHIGGSTDTLVAVNNRGDLFVWGQNEYGQLGPVSDEPQIFLPQHVPFKLGKVVAAEATGCSIIVCNTDGQAFTWGSHVLGFGPRVERLERPMQLDPPLFASSISELEQRVQKVFAGSICMGALNEAGHLFTWGSNRHGILALGHRNHQHFPFQVSFAESVKHASFGPDHSLFVSNRY